jgi:hypothetical protein
VRSKLKILAYVRQATTAAKKEALRQVDLKTRSTVVGSCKPNTMCFKRDLQSYSKCYCVVSVTKTFTLKGLQTIQRSTPCSIFCIPFIHHAYQVYHHFIVSICFGPLGSSSVTKVYNYDIEVIRWIGMTLRS